MKKLAALLLLASPVFGQYYLAEDKFCQISGVSTASPAVVTLTDAPSTCNLTNGATILINEVRGATALNVHLESSGDTAGRCRKVGTISGNTFTVLDCDNNSLSGAVHASCATSGTPPRTPDGNCAYHSGGRVSLARSATVTGNNFISSSEITRLTTTTGSGAAQVANPIYGLMTTQCAGRKTRGNYFIAASTDWGPTDTLACAWVWLISGDTAARDAALWDLNHPQQLVGHIACKEDELWCGASTSTQGDYPMHLFGESWYIAYKLMRSSLTSGERAAIADFMLRSYPWYRGGFGYNGVTVTTPSYKIIPSYSDYTSEGTITATAGSANVSCTGTCNWTTRIAAGDLISFPDRRRSDYSRTYEVASVTNNNALVLTGPAIINVSGEGYQTSAPWTSGGTAGGFMNQQLHANVAINNGGSGPQNYPSYPYGQDLPSPYYGYDSGGQPGKASNQDGNAATVHAIGQWMLGTALCEDDPRACMIAVRAHEVLVHQTIPFYLSYSNGFSPVGNQYQDQRSHGPMIRLGPYFANTWTNTSNPWTGTTFMSDFLRWFVFARVQTTSVSFPWAWKEPAIKGPLELLGMDRTMSIPTAAAANPTGTIEKQALYVLRNRHSMSSGPSIHPWTAGLWYAFYNHLATDSGAYPTDKTAVFQDTPYSTCASRYNETLVGSCDQWQGVDRGVFSNTGLAEANTHVAWFPGGIMTIDHALPAGATPSRLAIVRNSELLLGGDHPYSNMATNRDGNGVIIPSAPTYRAGGGYGEGTGCATNSYALRWFTDVSSVVVNFALGAKLSGDDSHAYSTQDQTQLYCSFLGVTNAWQRIIHMKGAGQDYIIELNDMSFSSGRTLRSWKHFPLTNTFGTNADGQCGTPASSTCLALSGGVATNTKGGARLNAAGLAISSANLLVRTDNGGTDFSYTTGAGYSGRFWFSPSSDGTTELSATSHTWAEVYQPGGTSITMPTRTKLTGTGWTGVQIADGSNPKAFIFRDTPSLTMSQTSAAITTTYTGTGQVAFADMAAGSYDFKLGGSPVAGCTGVSATTAGIVNCDSITAGAVTLTAASGGGGGGGSVGSAVRGGVIRGGTPK